jgi:hypothetical protein
MTKTTMRAVLVLALTALMATGAACGDDSKPSAANPSAAAGAASTPAPRMRSLKVDGEVPPAAAQADSAPTVNGTKTPAAQAEVPIVNGPKTPVAQAEPAPPAANGAKVTATRTSTGAGNRQMLNARPGSGALTQRQEGGGNTQILNVDAGAASISQTQKGSGNVQSMKIGTTESTPAPIPSATTR